MRSTLVRNLTARFQSYSDLISQIDDAALTERLAPPKHKSLREHLGCIIGARESYAKALDAGEWSGFSCSMTQYTHMDFAEKLKSSSRAVQDAIAGIGEWTPTWDELLLALAEHEVMHEGQIIRHVYGLEGTLPKSWKWA